MKRSIPFLALALSASILTIAPSWRSAPPVGPGGVLDSVVEFCETYDSLDAQKLGKLLLDRKGGMLFRRSEAGEFETADESEPTLLFNDVGWSESEFAARDSREFLNRLQKDFRELKELNGSVQTTVHSVHADCYSGDFSFAMFEFDRTYTNGEGETRTSPMRGTALLSWQEGRFRIWHWHASPR